MGPASPELYIKPGPGGINNPKYISTSDEDYINSLKPTGGGLFSCCLAAVSLAAAYTPEQQNTVVGVKLSFQVGQAYEKAVRGEDVAGFNTLVDQWNAWVMSNFGNDTSLLMQKMTVPVNLQSPYAAAINNSTSSIVRHQMDGTDQYTANDINQMSDAAIAKYYSSEQGRTQGADFLGGV